MSMNRYHLVLSIVPFLISWNTSAFPATNVKSASVYLEEGFDGGTLPSGWTVRQIAGTLATWSVTGMGTNPPVAPYRGAGQLKFNSNDASAGEQARLISPAINLVTASDPFIEFFMYHDDEFIDDADSLYIEVSTTDSIQGPWTTLHGFARPRVTSGWSKEAVSVLVANGSPHMFVAFRGVSKFGNNIYIDQFSVADSSFHDIGAVEILESDTGIYRPLAQQSNVGSRKSPAALQNDAEGALGSTILELHGQQAVTLSVIIQNFGTFDEQSYLVSWNVDGQAQTPLINGRTLSRNGRDTLSIALSNVSPGWRLITAWTTLASDSNSRNDTARIAIQVLDSTVVFYESFNALSFPPVGWSTINRDGGQEPAWFRGVSSSVFPPYEGAGFAGDNFQRANGHYIDDYLVSPPIPGVGRAGLYDSLVFWTRSVSYMPPAIDYPDSLMILLSTTGADTASFSTVLDYFSVPKTAWARRGYRLTGVVPDNSIVRIAFRYLHFNAGASGSNADFIGIDAVQLRHGIPTSVPIADLPRAFALLQNYPNPFNPTTTIQFTVPVGTYARTSMRVYDVLGREVAVLVDEIKSPGSYEMTWDARGHSSGVYLYKLESGSFISVRKMVVLR